MDDEVDRSRHTHPQTNPNPILKRAASDGMAHRLRHLPCRSPPGPLDLATEPELPRHRRPRGHSATAHGEWNVTRIYGLHTERYTPYISILTLSTLSFK